MPVSRLPTQSLLTVNSNLPRKNLTGSFDKHQSSLVS
jgi:hypothetical protein